MEKHLEGARCYCRWVSEQGYTPIAPHLLFTQFLDDGIPEQRDRGMKHALDLIEYCDELWVFGPHLSEGMQAEINLANACLTPVRLFPNADSLALARVAR